MEKNIITILQSKLYMKGLIKQVSGSKKEYIDNLIIVLTLWIITKIDNYDCSMYYENPSYIYERYKEGKVL